MATGFFIEFRPWGYLKKHAKELNRMLVKSKSHEIKVPHMALYGPSEARNLDEVASIVETVARKFTLVPFETTGFGYFDNSDKKWILLEVRPSPELEDLRLKLAEAFNKKKYLAQPWDLQQTYKFHISIGKTHDPKTFDRLRSKIIHFGRPEINQYLLRITIIGRHSKIHSEYDLILKHLLNRRQALSPGWRKKTIKALRGTLGYPGVEPKQPAMIEGVLNYFKNVLSKKSIYLISDTHFDHANIIKYCHRPFSSVAEMNYCMVKNWNDTVKDTDKVYFLGDWSYGRRARRASYWIKRLNGHITSIKAGHDRLHGVQSKVLKVGDYTFLLIHDPDERPNNYDGWIIHGHKHNNDPKNYPFINGVRKTINVSSELINYIPVSIDHLLSLDLDSIKWMRSINDQPERT
jgi:calcineurin-like phosphoesterase family protein/2'-5' RNA ligase